MYREMLIYVNIYHYVEVIKMVKDNWGNKEMKTRKNRIGIEITTIEITLPAGLLKRLEKLMEVKRYWTSRNNLIRDLIDNGLEEERKKLIELDGITDQGKLP